MRRAIAPLALVALFSAGVAALFLAVPIYMMQVYDRVLLSGSRETLIVLSAALALALATFGALEASRARLMRRLGDWFAASAAPTLAAAPIVPAGEDSDGDPMRALAKARDVAASPVSLALFDLAFAPFILLVLWVLHPLFAAITLGGALILLGLGVLGEMLAQGPLRRAQRRAGAALGELGSLRDRRQVAALGLWPLARARALEGDAGARAEMVVTGDRGAWIAAASKTARLATQGAALGGGALLVLEGAVTAGEMIAASIALGRALAPIEQLTGGWALLIEGRGALRTVAAALRAAPPSQLRAPAGSGGLAAREVVIEGPGQPTLLRLDRLDLGAGQILAVIGPTGAGKTVLAELAVGLRAPDHGVIVHDGLSPSAFTPDQWREQVGYAAQRPAHARGMIAELILGASLSSEGEGAPLDRARDAAMAMGLDRRIRALPQGYATMIDSERAALSAGFLRRLALARAFCGPKKLIVLDEAGADLDGAGQKALERAIAAASAGGAAVLVASATPWALAFAHQALALEGGEVVAYGPTAAVLSALRGEAARPNPTAPPAKAAAAATPHASDPWRAASWSVEATP